MSSDLDPSAQIDFSLYTRVPVFSLSEGIALARALVTACPPGMSGPAKKVLEKLKSRADDAQSALVERQRENSSVSGEDSRGLDQEMDNCWGGLRQRLEGYAALPRSVARSARAAEVLQKIFGDEGMGFLKESYAAQLTTMQALLQRIDEDKLAKELDALCGPEFLEQIRLLMPRYERMVHGQFQRDAIAGPNLLSHRRQLGRAIITYATAVCATVDEDDGSSVSRAAVALRPLDVFRESINSRRPRGGEEPEPAPEPTPN